MATRWYFRLLGPVTAEYDGQGVDIGGPTASALLAELLLRDTAGGSADDLISAVWGGPGVATRDSVYHYVRAVRRALAAGPGAELALQRQRYRLVIDDGEVDWRKFQRLVGQARRARESSRLAEAAALLREALQLWSGGPPLDGIGDRLPGARRELAERRLTTVEELAALELHESPGVVVDLLSGVAAEHPGRERTAALLIEALAILGQRDEVGVVYRRTYNHLRNERGLDPGPELTAAHQAALRGMPAPVPVPRPASPPPVPPNTRPISGLPRRGGHFTGRTAELARVTAAVMAGDGAVCVVPGMAGVGKTTLAVELAHRLADQFPDGCLFIDLYGHTPGHRPLEPSEALDRLLRRLGVDGRHIPPELPERMALYGDLLANRRTLVLLDNARDAVQARPLLPTAARCATLITSRSRLSALDDADALPLRVLDPVEGAALFRAVAGPERLAAEPDAADAIERILSRCGGLPLAIRIAAARYRARDHQSLTDLCARLIDAHSTLAELDDGDRSVAASFRVSFDNLPAGPRRTFALLAAHPGVDLDAYATAALTDEPVADAGRDLEHLADRHLLVEHSAGRYRFHDLIGSFARQYALPTVDERSGALHRLVDYYLRAAERADSVITPHRYRVPLDVLPREVAIPTFEDYPAALGWLVLEETNLTDVCRAAASAGLDQACWQLAFALRGYYFLAKRWAPWVVVHELALTATRRLGDPRAEAMTANNLGMVRIEQGDLIEAGRQYRESLRLFGIAGDEHGEHTAWANLAWILFDEGRYAEFLDEMGRTHAFYQRTGSARNAAITLRGIALAEAKVGRVQESIVHLDEALADFIRLNLPLDTTMTLNGLGESYAQAGDRQRATDFHLQALEASERCGSSYELARAHHRLGELAAAAGAHGDARTHLTAALAGYRSLGAPQAGEVDQLLAGVDAPA